MSGYINFPAKATVLERLWEMDSAPHVRADLYRAIAERLGSKTYDSAAFAFILIETLHQYEELVGEDLGDFLPRCVLVLTADQELAQSARQAFDELRRAAKKEGER